MTARLLVSAARKSSGKTTVAAGLCAALARRGRPVRPFKKGPDYIDPMWLSRAAGRPCINLDFHTMTCAEIRARLDGDGGGDAADGADGPGDGDGGSPGLAIIEGNKGLFDGVDPGGADSNAALAKTLGAPVLLVLDARGMTRGVAPLLLGYRAFDPQLDIAGVILNRTGGARHESKLRAAIAAYTDFAVLGALPLNPALGIAERHLGLVTCDEAAAEKTIAALADAVAAQVDLEAVEAIAARAAPPAAPDLTVAGDRDSRHRRPGDSRPDCHSGDSRSPESLIRRNTKTAKRLPPTPDLIVAIARDAAFNFYYPDDLAAFAAHGARLVEFDTLNDAAPPPADALFIGGGFPETHAARLAANRAMLDAVRAFVARGRPVYAECGGLMYLARSLTWRGQTWAMAGALPAQVEMLDRPVGRGYVQLQETADAPWPTVDGGDNGGGDAGRHLPAHEFHYSRARLPPDAKFAYRVRRGYGIDGQFDGWVHANTLANYAHFRHTAANPWVARFLAFIREHR
ncbi:MAG: cobyrinate a,c-diamide synthase [Gammaproteobacteria bacterium]|nr:cobyrinate a,c-diamide synthase [Gammaproteobacteria bacterium]